MQLTLALDVGQCATCVPEEERSLHDIISIRSVKSDIFDISLNIRVIQMNHMNEDCGITQQTN